MQKKLAAGDWCLTSPHTMTILETLFPPSFCFWVWPCVVLRSAVLAVSFQIPACSLEGAEWKGKDLDAVALLSNGCHMPVLLMLFWPPVQTTEPCRLLWRKLPQPRPKPVKWVTPKFWNWSDLLSGFNL